VELSLFRRVSRLEWR